MNWHNTYEHFTVEEYIRSNCEYPGGKVEQIITATHVEASVDWNDLVKWCAEGAFEYIRETEFLPLPIRLSSLR